MTQASNPDGIETHRTELQARLAKLDQNLSAHSILRDRYSRRSSALSLGLILSSTIVALLAVASHDIRSALGSNADLLIAFFGVVVLLGSIAELSLRWRECAAAHAEAARALGRLKLLMTRELALDRTISDAKFYELRQSYEDVHDLIAKIPESQFLALKAAHRRKVEISRIISKNPSASITLLRVALFARDNRRALNDE